MTKSHRLSKACLEYFTGAGVFLESLGSHRHLLFAPWGNPGYCGVTGDTCWWLQPEPQSGERRNQAGKSPGKIKSHVQAHHLSSPPYGTLGHVRGYRRQVRGHSTRTTQSQIGYPCMLPHPAASLETASAYVPPICLGHSHTKSDICLFNKVKAFGEKTQRA